MSTARRRVVARVAMITIGATVLATAAAGLLAWSLGVPLALVNTALLLGSTFLLGAVWALRRRLVLRAEGPCPSAAVVPAIAVGFFLGPPLVLGSTSAHVTASAALLAMPLVDRAWARWVAADAPEGMAATVSAALGAAPLAALAFATFPVAGPLALAIGLVASAFVGALAVLRLRALEIEEQRFTRFVRDVEVCADEMVRPEAPRWTDPMLRQLAQEVHRRAELHARTAAVDASSRAQVAEARALRARFMAVMSHELRSPLNSIVGFTQVLSRGLDGPVSDEQRESISMIHRSADELIMLLTDVLDLARLEAGRLSLQRVWTPSVEILTESVARGRALVAGHDVEIEAELQPGLPPVFVDHKRIQQAVLALFRHAASSLRRTTVRLRARVASGPPGPERHLRVEIHDAIGAIPAAEVEQIFEAFQEISAPTGRRLGGLGMALTLSRGLVRLHGGEVWAYASPGAGTVLSVALPLDESEPISEPPRALDADAGDPSQPVEEPLRAPLARDDPPPRPVLLRNTSCISSSARTTIQAVANEIHHGRLFNRLLRFSDR